MIQQSMSMNNSYYGRRKIEFKQQIKLFTKSHQDINEEKKWRIWQHYSADNATSEVIFIKISVIYVTWRKEFWIVSFLSVSLRLPYLV